MRLRDLKLGVGSAWPPVWGSSYRGLQKFDPSDEATLVEARVGSDGPTVELVVEEEGTLFTGQLRWDGEPDPTRVVEVLTGARGRALRDLPDLEV